MMDIDYNTWRMIIGIFLLISFPTLLNQSMGDWRDNFEEMLQAKYAELYLLHESVSKDDKRRK